MTSRIHNIQKYLQNNEGSLAFLSDPKNVFYLTGFMCEPHERLLGLFIFPEGEPFLVCPKMEVQQAKASGWNYLVIGYEDHEDPWSLIKKHLPEGHERLNGNLAIETKSLPFYKAEALQVLFPSTAMAPIETSLEAMRMIKDTSELEAMKKAAEMADFAINIGVNAIKKGRTEQAIIAEIEYELTKRGYSQMAFSTMVLTGENSASPHGHPGNKQIKEGDFVLFDLGVVADGYCSDITRTVCYKHASDKQQEIYETVLHAERKAIEACRDGLRLGDLDSIARQVIEENGYGDYFPHRLGHGLGLEAHEAPSMSQNNNELMKNGMVFTVEPGIYVPEVGGVRIEDDIYLSEKGPVSLTQYPKHLQIIS